MKHVHVLTGIQKSFCQGLFEQWKKHGLYSAIQKFECTGTPPQVVKVYGTLCNTLFLYMYIVLYSKITSNAQVHLPLYRYSSIG